MKCYSGIVQQGTVDTGREKSPGPQRSGWYLLWGRETGRAQEKGDSTHSPTREVSISGKKRIRPTSVYESNLNGKNKKILFFPHLNFQHPLRKAPQIYRFLRFCIPTFTQLPCLLISSSRGDFIIWHLYFFFRTFLEYFLSSGAASAAGFKGKVECF